MACLILVFCSDFATPSRRPNRRCFAPSRISAFAVLNLHWVFACGEVLCRKWWTRLACGDNFVARVLLSECVESFVNLHCGCCLWHLLRVDCKSILKDWRPHTSPTLHVGTGARSSRADMLRPCRATRVQPNEFRYDGCDVYLIGSDEDLSNWLGHE